MKEGKTGFGEGSAKNILFGAGTIHKGLKYEGSSWNFAASIVGATSGGSKLSIVPEISKVEVDGVLVPVKGLNVKTGETATMEVNFIELTKEIIKAATFGMDGTATDTNFDLIESKADIAFVGKTLDGRNIIAILDNALCTSGFEQEGKNKEGTVGTYTFECNAEDSGDLSTLPWHIYYPKAA